MKCRSSGRRWSSRKPDSGQSTSEAATAKLRLAPVPIIGIQARADSVAGPQQRVEVHAVIGLTDTPATPIEAIDGVGDRIAILSAAWVTGAWRVPMILPRHHGPARGAGTIIIYRPF
jgi:hypothetical protein